MCPTAIDFCAEIKHAHGNYYKVILLKKCFGLVLFQASNARTFSELCAESSSSSRENGSTHIDASIFGKLPACEFFFHE